MASTSTKKTSSSAPKSKTTTNTSSTSSDAQSLYLSANFAHNPKSPITVNYDHEIYLQLMAEEGAKTKTPHQVYREEWVRRALDPAISDPRGDPSPIDLECAESQRARDRV